jgi:hypothetical protein
MSTLKIERTKTVDFVHASSPPRLELGPTSTRGIWLSSQVEVRLTTSLVSLTYQLERGLLGKEIINMFSTRDS